MEGAISDVKSTTTFTTNLLPSCAMALKRNNLDEAMGFCKQYLDQFPISNNSAANENSFYQNYLLLSSRMINDNHNHEGVIDLLQIKNILSDFVNSFYLKIDKKGYHYPTPEIKKEDVELVYHICASLDTFVGHKLGITNRE